MITESSPDVSQKHPPYTIYIITVTDQLITDQKKDDFPASN